MFTIANLAIGQHYAMHTCTLFLTLSQGNLTEGEGSVQLTSLY
jgi:hypothetical protein